MPRLKGLLGRVYGLLVRIFFTVPAKGPYKNIRKILIELARAVRATRGGLDTTRQTPELSTASPDSQSARQGFESPVVLATELRLDYYRSLNDP